MVRINLKGLTKDLNKKWEVEAGKIKELKEKNEGLSFIYSDETHYSLTYDFLIRKWDGAFYYGSRGYRNKAKLGKRDCKKIYEIDNEIIKLQNKKRRLERKILRRIIKK